MNTSAYQGLSGLAVPIAVLALLSVSAGAALGARLLRRTGSEWRRARLTVRGSGLRLPAWIRAALPVVEMIAAPLGPTLSPSFRERIYVALRSAEFEEDLQPQQFVALVLVCAAAGLAVALLLWRFSVLGLVVAGALMLLPWVWLSDARRRRHWEILRDLSIYVDMLTLALEAGGALSVALKTATERMPDSPLQRAFRRVQNDLRAGRSRAEALRALAARVDAPAVASLVGALVQADSSGGSLSTVLRAQSEQRLDERFARAEKLALEAPVKLLAPLILCVFPCTFLVLAFPVVIRFLEA